MPEPGAKRKSILAGVVFCASISVISFCRMLSVPTPDVSVTQGSRGNLFVGASRDAGIPATIAFFSFVATLALLLQLRSSPRLTRREKRTRSFPHRSK
jgi:hypothetical protein